MIKKLTLAALLAAAAIQPAMAKDTDFDYVVDRFADIEVLRYKVPDFEKLSARQKALVYYLTEAAQYGRDILWDQNGKYNLPIRRLIEQVYTNYSGNKDSRQYKALEKYLKQIWFGNGIHHHYSMDKFVPGFDETFLRYEVSKLPAGKQPADLDMLCRVIFDPAVMPKRVNQAEGADLIVTSANNLYEGVTQQQVEDYYAALKDTTIPDPVSYGLNTRIAMVDGKVTEQPYKVGGLYSDAIVKIVENLRKAQQYAENDKQAGVIGKLITTPPAICARSTNIPSHGSKIPTRASISSTVL